MIGKASNELDLIEFNEYSNSQREILNNLSLEYSTRTNVEDLIIHNLYFFFPVKPKQEDLKIEVSESETNVNLTCLMNRIKPKVADMFFSIAGQRYNSSIVSIINYDLTLTNSLFVRCIFC